MSEPFRHDDVAAVIEVLAAADRQGATVSFSRTTEGWTVVAIVDDTEEPLASGPTLAATAQAALAAMEDPARRRPGAAVSAGVAALPSPRRPG